MTDRFVEGSLEYILSNYNFLNHQASKSQMSLPVNYNCKMLHMRYIICACCPSRARPLFLSI